MEDGLKKVGVFFWKENLASFRTILPNVFLLLNRASSTSRSEIESKDMNEMMAEGMLSWDWKRLMIGNNEIM